MNKNTTIQFGCGLIRIGREWGFIKKDIPNDEEVTHFLQEAVKLGIRFFDTAPSYNLSEKRLGAFINTLSSEVRERLTIATKCGEHWDTEKQTSYADHSYNALVKSIDASLSLLGRIDILQIHKATPEVLKSDDVQKAIAYAQKIGIKRFGASIPDLETAEEVTNRDIFSIIQLPYNPDRADMKIALEILRDKGKFLIINRPFNMGSMVYADENKQTKEDRLTQAYRFITDEHFNGVILSGTCNVHHLKENLEAFQNAIR